VGDCDLSSASCVIEDNIGGYLVGEFKESSKYEVITVWVDRKYKGLNLALKFYEQIFEELYNRKCAYMECDIISGAFSRVLTASPISRLIQNRISQILGLSQFVFPKVEDSYDTQISQTKKEKFQKIVVRVSTINWCLKLIRIKNMVNNLWFVKPSFVIFPSAIIALIFGMGYALTKR